MNKYLITYASQNGRIHKTLETGRSSVEAVVKLFSTCPYQHRLNLVDCVEVTDETNLDGLVVWEARGNRIVEVRY